MTCLHARVIEMTQSVQPKREEDGGLAPHLAHLLTAARNRVGLHMLLLFGHDPTACDTASGFALRLHCPVAEVDDALRALRERGILGASRCPGADAPTAYWLSEDAGLFRSLGDLVKTYSSDPDGRRHLFRALGA